MEKLMNIQDPFIGNIAGCLLIGVLLVSHQGQIPFLHKTDVNIYRLTILTGFYCFWEFVSACMEGIPGMRIHIILYICYSLLFLLNMLFTIAWVWFIAEHLGFFGRKTVRYSLFLVGCLLLVLNLFYPVVFTLEDNHYQQKPGSIFYLLAAVIYFADAIRLYHKAKQNGGILKYFPVWLYIIPVSLGILVEYITESSFIGIGNAIAISAILNSLQDERIYRDSLTGLYNRTYLEQVKKKMKQEKGQYISGIMLDLNRFKYINDTFGHAEGDQALILSADIIKNGVGSFGEVIRYAGDEFIVLINTWEEEKIQSCMQRIEDGFAIFNREKKKPYPLSASMGYAIFHAETESVSEFLNAVDRDMYRQKEQYYKENPGVDRRR